MNLNGSSATFMFVEILKILFIPFRCNFIAIESFVKFSVPVLSLPGKCYKIYIKRGWSSSPLWLSDSIFPFHFLPLCRAKGCVLECCTLSRLVTDRLSSLHSLEQMLTPFKIPQGWPSDLGSLCPYLSGRLFGGNLVPFKPVRIHMGNRCLKNRFNIPIGFFQNGSKTKRWANFDLLNSLAPYTNVLELRRWFCPL